MSPRRKTGILSKAQAGEMAKTSPNEFFRQVRAEASKIYWPSRQETVTTAIFCGIMIRRALKPFGPAFGALLATG